MSLLLAVVALAFASCQHKYADWTPGTQDANMGVYFANIDNFEVSAETTSVDIEVKRLQTEEAATISLRSEDVEGFGFNIPESVAFAAGAESTTLTISFDGSQLEAGKEYAVRIKLDENQASKYAVSENTFIIMVPEPWKSLGKGIYRDDFMAPLYGGSAGVMVEVDVVQHEVETHRYRIVEPFSQNAIPYIIGGVPSDMTFTTPGYIEFNVYEDNSVEIPSSWLGFKLDVGTGQPENFWLATVYKDENTPLRGQLNNGVMTFPTPKSIMWHIDDGRGNYANQSGLFALALPGAVIADYSIAAEYAGMVVEADNTTASAVINFAVGSDVEGFKFTVVEGTPADAAAIVAQIVEGSEEITIFEAGASDLVWKLQIETGVQSIVAVPYGNGEAQTADAIVYTFFYPGVGGGAETPDPEFAVEIGSVAGITGNPDYEANYPSDQYFAIYIGGNATDMKSVKMLVANTSAVEESGLSTEELVAEYGDDASSEVIGTMAESGYYLVVYQGQAGAAISVLVSIETIYGTTKSYRADHVVGA